jgi:hypothetical protein
MEAYIFQSTERVCDEPALAQMSASSLQASSPMSELALPALRHRKSPFAFSSSFSSLSSTWESSIDHASINPGARARFTSTTASTAPVLAKGLHRAEKAKREERRKVELDRTAQREKRQAREHRKRRSGDTL